MEYRGINYSFIEDNGVERVDKNGNDVICNGFYCTIESKDGDAIDWFCIAVGFEINEQKYEEAEKYIHNYIDEGYDGIVDMVTAFENDEDIEL